jgi:hypothetical protein
MQVLPYTHVCSKNDVAGQLIACAFAPQMALEEKEQRLVEEGEEELATLRGALKATVHTTIGTIEEAYQQHLR